MNLHFNWILFSFSRSILSSKPYVEFLIFSLGAQNILNITEHLLRLLNSELLSTAKMCWVVLSPFEHYWALLSSTEYCWILLSITEYYWVLLSLLSTTELYWVLLSITEYDFVLLINIFFKMFRMCVRPLVSCITNICKDKIYPLTHLLTIIAPKIFSCAPPRL